MVGPIVNPGSSGASKTTAPKAASLGATGGKVGPEHGKNSPIQKARKAASDVEDLVQKLSARSRSIGRTLRFRVDLLGKRSVIQVFDRDTGELIRQIPQEKVSALARSDNQSDLHLLDDLA